MRIAIIGGGISGLAVAHRLEELKKEAKSPLDYELFEADERLGGTIETEKRDGFILEKGPDSFLSEKPWAIDLCKRIGIADELIGTNAAFRKGFILRKRALETIPEGFYLIAPTKVGSFLRSPLFSLRGKLRMMMEPFVGAQNIGQDESVGSFIRRRFGEEALKRVGQAMIAGIYTGDPEELSILATMPRFKDYEKNYGSVIRGLFAEKGKKKDLLAKASGPRYSLFVSCKEGLQTLTDRLEKKLPSQSLKIKTPVQSLAFDKKSNQWTLFGPQGSLGTFDSVCLTISAKKTQELVKPLSLGLFEKLAKITYESVATLNLAYRVQDIRHALDGFGFVVPAIEERSLIACTFCSTKFAGRAPKGMVLLRAFVGGAFGRDYFRKEDRDLERSVERDLSEMLGITHRPVFSVLKRYPDAMVQYRVGHEDVLRDIDLELCKLPGLFLTGSGYRGVGIPDCILDAERQAEIMVKR